MSVLDGVFADDDLWVTIDYLHDRNATVARVRVGSYVVTGSSKRIQGDVGSEEIGVSLAVARALDKLSRQLKKDAKDAEATHD